jgi:hypothetical protein
VSSADLIRRQLGFDIALCLCMVGVAACNSEVPITSSPTRNVQEQLLGDWTSSDGKGQMTVRGLDEGLYVVYYDGDLFRAYHSDAADIAFVSVQDLNSKDRKYAYVAYVVWKLSDDGKHLSLRNVNDKVVPKETKDSATVVALLSKNAHNPELFGEEIEFRKVK